MYTNSLAAFLRTFDESKVSAPIVGLRVDIVESRAELPMHEHEMGQLVLTLKGGVSCEVPGAIWMVPAHSAVWIPGRMPHSIRATPNARMCYLFVQPRMTALPERCCTLAISSLVRELIIHMADQPDDYDAESATGRMARVLLEELARMPVQQVCLPTSSEPRVSRIAKMLSDHPGDRRTLAEWAQLVAMSERSLARLVQQETGLTFGRWRQQLHLIVAMQQLAAGESVQRVADRLGYESVTAFITMFKKALGLPPAKYFAGLDQNAPT
jgi:AraC-like DNA-binding protein/quercetin dioxygenase-like cupin family protein